MDVFYYNWPIKYVNGYIFMCILFDTDQFMNLIKIFSLIQLTL